MSSIVVFRVVQQSLDPRLYETPWTGVQWLFLTPYDGLRIRIAVEVVSQLSPGEGVELFDSCDRCIGNFVGLSVLDKRSIDLTTTQYYSFNVFVLVDSTSLVRRVSNDPLEV